MRSAYFLIGWFLDHGRNAFKLEFGFAEFFDAMAGALFDDLLERVACVEFESGEIDRDRGRKDDAVTEPFDLEIGMDGVFFPRDIGEPDEVVFC